MNVVILGCSYRTTPVGVRERLAFTDEQVGRALDRLSACPGREAVLLSTCNRVELYLGDPGEGKEAGQELTDFLADFHGLPADEIRPHLYVHRGLDAVRHLFRVAASLDSMLVGEGQIAGQVKRAYERAQARGTTGPLLNALFPHARRVAKRVRAETGISQGHVSVSSAAVDYVREVFDHFGDKTVLVIGAGKMGELTLKHLRELQPKRILVTNRSPEKARQVAAGCGGEAVRVGAARRGAGAGRHRAEHHRGAGADHDRRALPRASRRGAMPAAGGDPRHRRAARLRPGRPRR